MNGREDMTAYLSNRVLVTLSVTLVIANIACTTTPASDTEAWNVNVALVPRLDEEQTSELWLIVKNMTGYSKMVCLRYLTDGTVDEFAMYPVRPVERCQDPSSFQPLTPSNTGVFRLPPPDEEWLTTEWRKHITVAFVVRSWIDHERKWSADRQDRAQWEGSSHEARALGDRLIGR